MSETPDELMQLLKEWTVPMADFGSMNVEQSRMFRKSFHDRIIEWHHNKSQNLWGEAHEQYKFDLKMQNERIKELEAKVKDYEDSYRIVMEEKCSGDEIHCTCVPSLRRRIKELELHYKINSDENKQWEEYLKAKVEKLRGALQMIASTKYPGGAEPDVQHLIDQAKEALKESDKT